MPSIPPNIVATTGGWSGARWTPNPGWPTERGVRIYSGGPKFWFAVSASFDRTHVRALVGLWWAMPNSSVENLRLSADVFVCMGSFKEILRFAGNELVSLSGLTRLTGLARSWPRSAAHTPLHMRWRTA